ncbi:MAG TPA: ArsR family transcriptional regulator [Treponema sp.]|nr:ArsR family transcriptional regulator [Treponema sp.]
MNEEEKVLIVNPLEDIEILKALASEPRIGILNLIRKKSLNVNEISDALKLPQSTVATHIAKLEKAGLISSESVKARKGNQKICEPSFREVLVQFPEDKKEDNSVEVEMPIGLFTDFHVTAPCGLCSTEKIIGFLDMPDSFLNPNRMSAGLIWCTTGFVEYKFPNNALSNSHGLTKLELSMELSSETPGTNPAWLSDITMWLNGVDIGTWTSPGDFGDRRGKYTPMWWKLEGSQYGLLKHWSVTENGSYIDGIRISGVCLEDLHLGGHHSVTMRIGLKETAAHPGGMNIFGRGFGNYDQGIKMFMQFAPE